MPAASPEVTDMVSTLNFKGASIPSNMAEMGGETPSNPPTIVLPHQEPECVGHIAIDIGGSLIKLVYFSSDAQSYSDSEEDSDTCQAVDLSNGTPTPTRPLHPGPQPQDHTELAGPDDMDSSPTAVAEGTETHLQGPPTDLPQPTLPSVPRERQGAHGLPDLASKLACSVGVDGGREPAAQVRKPCVKERPVGQQWDAGNGRGGRLHFVKFETARIEDALDFIEQKQLHRRQSSLGSHLPIQVRATGGGAYKFADRFKERLGVTLKKEDEMGCLVQGCNFLLSAIESEAFEYRNDGYKFLTHRPDSLYPYLLVNIGSGVSMVKVDGEGQYERVSGTNLGGGTFWGLCRLLTGARNFDDVLRLSSQGNSANVDMLVGDIYGGRDYENIGLAADTIASSFGKVVSQDKRLEDYNKADIALALCRMVSYNIGHLAFLNAKRYNIPRVFFGGFFIRGHPYTMSVMTYAINFWSKGEMTAMFLRHEGFLGAMGAFLKGHPLAHADESAAAQLQARFVERFATGSSFTDCRIQGLPFSCVSEKVSWVEKFLQVGAAAAEAAREEHEASHTLLQSNRYSLEKSLSLGADAAAALGSSPPDLAVPFLQEGQATSNAQARAPQPKAGSLKIGVLHYKPSLKPFPLLQDAAQYVCNTHDLHDPEERMYWLNLLDGNVDNVVEKACMSAGQHQASVRRRAQAMGKALHAHFERLKGELETYGRMGLSEIFDLREECLREFRFNDVHAHDKARENEAAVQVLGDLIAELDAMQPWQRLLCLVQSVLAANIFDWGAQACVNRYHEGTILGIYQQARQQLEQRPWLVDDFDALQALWFQHDSDGTNALGRCPSPFRRVMLFVDNAGADVVLGMLPLARELLCMGSEVVMVANSLPAINDITASELEKLVDEKCVHICPVLNSARASARQALQQQPSRVVPSYVPPSTQGAQGQASRSGRADAVQQPGRPCASTPALYICESGTGGPCLNLRRVSHAVAEASSGVDLVVIEGQGRSIHTNLHARLQCPVLKLAMIKTEWVAKRLFDGKLFDSICKLDKD